ncbi:PAS domain S-box protein [Azospirillum sp. SYSU D00513]|uniref:hybrid sensor histidine kinase/response regulator n=1 Tax=Azospirillum sp. SYSU D00513 TaxID=2812561 RepID=UPI0032B39D8B
MPFRVAHFGDERSERLLREAVGLSPDPFELVPGETADGTAPDSAEDGAAAEARPDLFVLGSDSYERLSQAQRLRASAPSAQILFLVPAERLERFRGSLPFLPHMASAWTADADAPPRALAEILAKAAQSSRRRASMATLRDRINRQLSPARPEDEAERRLKQLALSEGYLATLLSQAPDAFIALTPGGTILAWNAAAARLFGVPPEGAVGRAAAEALPPEIHVELSRLASAGLGGGGGGEAAREVTFRSAGGPRWVELRLAPVRGEQGGITTLSVTVHDVTQRRAAEARLRESEARYRTVTETLPQLVWTCRTNGSCDYLSRQWIEYTGIAEAEQLGLGWIDRVIHPDDRQRTLDHWMGAVRGLHPYSIEYRIRRHDGAYRWFMTRGTPIRSETGEIVQWFGTCTDIEEIVQARETLARDAEELERRVAQEVARRTEAEEALRQAQKMEAVGQLTGGLAHDFNNLLTGITGSLELMQARIAQGRVGELDRYIHAAQGAAKRAAALTHRLLAFSRRQTLDPKPTNVNRLVAGMEELIRRTIGPSIELEVVGAVGLWSAQVDPNQLENALLNLCINARDAMPDGGRLTIETANRWLDERAARQRDMAPGQYLSLCVTDTGTGMTPEVIQRAFEPFFTTKPLGMGTGLGLSMIYGFARQSGGQVRIYSEVGVGTTMCIYLPRHHGEEDHPEIGRDPADGAAATRGETVLVVDDEAMVRMLVTEVLEDLGYLVIEAADGPGGLEVLRSDRRVDLLVTDVGLPGGMNGRQLADGGRILRPGLKVLFITGYAENAVVGNGHLEPGMQVLTKPFAVEELAKRVKGFFA